MPTDPPNALGLASNHDRNVMNAGPLECNNLALDQSRSTRLDQAFWGFFRRTV